MIPLILKILKHSIGGKNLNKIQIDQPNNLYQRLWLQFV